MKKDRWIIPYACAPSNSVVKIKAKPYTNITFKNERGVPVLCRDRLLEVTARGDRDTTSIYAYDLEDRIVGKVNVLSYDKVTRKVCLVPVGDVKVPDAATIKQGLDEIFAQLMVDFDVTIGDPINIAYKNGKRFTHGGSGVIGVYNTDQKAAIDKLKELGVDNETIYVFMVEDAETLNDVDKQDAVSGYMPRGYQFGFVYKDLKNVRTMAHEIAHGAFHLRHTFDPHDFLATQSSTDNLMDYNYTQPTMLNHWQWADVHQPKSVRFKWLQDEAGAENIIVTANWITLDKTIEGLFLTPSGYPLFLSLTKGDKVAVLTDQVMAGTDELLSTPLAVYGFSTHGKTYFADIKDNIFHGYYDTDSSVFTYYEDNDGSTKNSLEEAMSSYTLVAWDGKSSFDEIIVDNNKWFEPRDDWNAFTASGHILICVDEYTFRPCGYLLRKYANSPVMQSDVMRRAIEKDPCILNEKYMIHFAEVAPTKSEWMNDFDLVFGVMLNVALFPAEADFLFGMLGEGSAEWVAQLAKQLGEKAVQELTRKAVLHQVKKDGAAFFRGAVSQLYVGCRREQERTYSLY